MIEEFSSVSKEQEVLLEPGARLVVEEEPVQDVHFREAVLVRVRVKEHKKLLEEQLKRFIDSKPK